MIDVYIIMYVYIFNIKFDKCVHKYLRRYKIYFNVTYLYHSVKLKNEYYLWL